MNISATIAKMNAIRAALFCAVFCATALCPAQETARGIVAEKIDDVKDSTERPEPEIRFVKDSRDDDFFRYFFISVSSDLKFIVFADFDNQINSIEYLIVDFATGYILRTISLPHKNVWGGVM